MSTLHLIFRVGGSEYVLPAERVLHMDVWEGATAVPGVPEWVLGLVQVRGRVVPVVDLRRRFGLPPVEPTLYSRVVVVQDEARVVGLLVDSAREVVQLEADAFRRPPEVVAEQAGGFIDAVAQAGERLVMRLDLRRVLGTENVGAAAPTEGVAHAE